MNIRSLNAKNGLVVLLLLTILSACHTPLHFQRKQSVLPDNKPSEEIFSTPVSSHELVLSSSSARKSSENEHGGKDEGKQAATWQSSLCTRLEFLLKDDLLKVSQLGLYVYDLSSDSLLFSYNGDQRMRPASCEKVVTAVSALTLLGAEYVFTPTVLSPGWGWCWDDAVTGMTAFGNKGKRHSAEVLYRESKPRTLMDVLMPMMKNSDNLLAESVFWQLPGQESQKGLKLKDCQEKVGQVMRMAGLEPEDYVVADGSGLSLYNYISPRALVMLLRFAYRNSAIFEVFYPTLPIAGVDGTLQNRMKDTRAEGNVRAKTGTVTGISSLSGYCQAANGHLLCFSIINQGIAKMASGRSFQDRLCQLLTEVK